VSQSKYKREENITKLCLSIKCNRKCMMLRSVCVCMFLSLVHEMNDNYRKTGSSYGLPLSSKSTNRQNQ